MPPRILTPIPDPESGSFMAAQRAEVVAPASLTPPAGAFYYMLPLPAGVSEEAAIAYLAREHAILLLPGSAFGAPGSLRLSYGCLTDADGAAAVAARLARAVRLLLHDATQI